MNETNSSSEKISKFNRVADEIAFRTNILALNAAVEAAGTGEPGIKFAKVSGDLCNPRHRALVVGNSGSLAREDGMGRSPAQLRAVSSNSADLSALCHSLASAGHTNALAPVAKASLSYGRNSFPMDATKSNF